MSNYNAPIKDMQFVLNELAGLDRVAQLPGYEEATPDVVEALLEEAGRPITLWQRKAWREALGTQR